MTIYKNLSNQIVTDVVAVHNGQVDYVSYDPALQVGCCELQGARPNQEDAVLIAAVPQYRTQTKEQTVQQLKETFAVLQDQCGNNQKQGSTGIVTLIDKNKITTASVGDSEAYLVIFRDGKIKELTRLNTTVHNAADNPAEFTRATEVALRNGASPPRKSATMGVRLGSGLAVTRSFGDKDSEEYGLSHEPDIFEKDYSIEGGKEHGFVITACDGLMEKMEESDLHQILIANQDKNPDDLAKILADLAVNNPVKEKKSGDNVSVIVTPLGVTPQRYKSAADYLLTTEEEEKAEYTTNNLKEPIITGVFDGHGGREVSQKLAENFLPVFRTLNPNQRNLKTMRKWPASRIVAWAKAAPLDVIKPYFTPSPHRLARAAQQLPKAVGLSDNLFAKLNGSELIEIAIAHPAQEIVQEVLSNPKKLSDLDLLALIAVNNDEINTQIQASKIYLDRIAAIYQREQAKVNNPSLFKNQAEMHSLYGEISELRSLMTLKSLAEWDTKFPKLKDKYVRILKNASLIDANGKIIGSFTDFMQKVPSVLIASRIEKEKNFKIEAEKYSRLVRESEYLVTFGALYNNNTIAKAIKINETPINEKSLAAQLILILTSADLTLMQKIIFKSPMSDACKEYLSKGKDVNYRVALLNIFQQASSYQLENMLTQLSSGNPNFPETILKDDVLFRMAIDKEQDAHIFNNMNKVFFETKDETLIALYKKRFDELPPKLKLRVYEKLVATNDSFLSLIKPSDLATIMVNYSKTAASYLQTLAKQPNGFNLLDKLFASRAIKAAQGVKQVATKPADREQIVTQLSALLTQMPAGLHNDIFKEFVADKITSAKPILLEAYFHAQTFDFPPFYNYLLFSIKGMDEDYQLAQAEMNELTATIVKLLKLDAKKLGEIVLMFQQAANQQGMDQRQKNAINDVLSKVEESFGEFVKGRPDDPEHLHLELEVVKLLQNLQIDAFEFFKYDIEAIKNYNQIVTKALVSYCEINTIDLAIKMQFLQQFLTANAYNKNLFIQFKDSLSSINISDRDDVLNLVTNIEKKHLQNSATAQAKAKNANDGNIQSSPPINDPLINPIQDEKLAVNATPILSNATKLPGNEDNIDDLIITPVTPAAKPPKSSSNMKSSNLTATDSELDSLIANWPKYSEKKEEEIQETVAQPKSKIPSQPIFDLDQELDNLTAALNAQILSYEEKKSKLQSTALHTQHVQTDVGEANVAPSADVIAGGETQNLATDKVEASELESANLHKVETSESESENLHSGNQTKDSEENKVEATEIYHMAFMSLMAEKDSILQQSPPFGPKDVEIMNAKKLKLIEKAIKIDPTGTSMIWINTLQKFGQLDPKPKTFSKSIARPFAALKSLFKNPLSKHGIFKNSPIAINTFKDAKFSDRVFLEDWNRIVQEQITIDGKPIKELIQEAGIKPLINADGSEVTFSDERDLINFLKSNLVKNKYHTPNIDHHLITYLQRSGLLTPVTSATVKTLDEISMRKNEKMILFPDSHITWDDRPAQQRTINFISTQDGFYVQEIMQLNACRLVTKKDGLTIKEEVEASTDNHLFTAKATIKVNLAGKAPKFSIIENSIEYGNDKIKKIMDNKGWLRNLMGKVVSLVKRDTKEKLSNINQHKM